MEYMALDMWREILQGKSELLIHIFSLLKFVRGKRLRTGQGSLHDMRQIRCYGREPQYPEALGMGFDNHPEHKLIGITFPMPVPSGA
jgi:hypothetical protein